MPEGEGGYGPLHVFVLAFAIEVEGKRAKGKPCFLLARLKR